MYSDILNTIKTHEELKDLKDEIDLLLSSLYEDHGGAFDKVLSERVRVGTSRIVSDALARSKVDKAEFLKGLVKELESLKVFKLTLAVEPTKKNIDKIYEWVQTNVGEKIVLEISQDSSIIAGTIFSYEGEYRDLSFAKVFEEKFEEKREEIGRILST